MASGSRISRHLHSNTSILDLLHAKTFHFLAFDSTGAQGETKGIISVVSWDGTSFLPLAVVGDAFKPSSENEDLEQTSIWNHLNSLKCVGCVGNVREGDAGRGREEPSIGRLGVENVGSRRTQVKGEMDSEFLGHESDGGKHGNATVLDLGVLEPPYTSGTSVLQEFATQWWALVSSLDTDTECIVDGRVQSSGAALMRGGSECRSRRKEQAKGRDCLHGAHFKLAQFGKSETKKGCRETL